MSGLAREDIAMAVAFLGVVVIGVGYQAVRAMVADSPRSRIRQRLIENVADVAPVDVEEEGSDAAGHAKKRLGGDSRIVQLLMQLKGQIDHMGGAIGLRAIALVAVLAAAAAIVLAKLAGWNLWLCLSVALPTAGLGGYSAFVVTVNRYRNRFLNGFPDALDLMIRAVRAGVPVVHAIITAGKELPYPVGREFQIMGDSLRLGMDQQDVMDAATKRIGIPDFRFFVVCLQLQRETGGPLADTLENLSGIIRARREVRLKTRALTAQGRAASKIIAMVPFIVVGALKFVGGDYMDIMFDTERGQRLLWVALALVVSGLAIISRMSRLED
ncbi:MAG: type II secretion system F family protein [Bacteroidota bacterium]